MALHPFPVISPSSRVAKVNKRSIPTNKSSPLSSRAHPPEEKQKIALSWCGRRPANLPVLSHTRLPAPGAGVQWDTL